MFASATALLIAAAPGQCPGGVCPLPKTPKPAPAVATDGVFLPGVAVGPAVPAPVFVAPAAVPVRMPAPKAVPAWVPVAKEVGPVRRWFRRCR